MARAAGEAVYPRVCAGCGMRGTWLCDLCEAEVPALAGVAVCPRCGLPGGSGPGACAELSSAIAWARSAFPYDGWGAEAVRRLKYQGEPARAAHLGPLMMPLLAGFGRVDALVPVPLHRSRERTRGYNQAAKLAEAISQETGVPVLPLLCRTVPTVSQTTLSGEERRQNVRDVFAVDPAWQPAPGGRYVLIDDVRTTGATLGACAEALGPLQPAEVGVLTFALDLHRDRLQALRRAAVGIP